jgi:hypothetical protein
MANAIIDIFIKSYYKDFIWLEYCLKSIKKHASGFRKVIVVVEPDHPIPNSISSILPIDIHYVPFPKKQPTVIHHGLGYLWQQYIKLSWTNYTDADAVFFMDSDEMLTTPTTPDSFKTDGKFHWFFIDWKDMGNGQCWKPSTDFILKKETEYSGMCITGFVFQRETTISLKNHLCSIHEVADIWDIFIKYNMPTCSEFNIYGLFVLLFNRTEYTCLINVDRSLYHNITIHKSWSWGGLDENEKQKRQELLLM